jgi:hypothetical protein
MSVSQGEEQREAPAVREPGQAVAAEEPAGEAAAQIRTLDFSQPTKFTTELKRRIVRALDPFCEALGGWLAGELKPRSSSSTPTSASTRGRRRRRSCRRTRSRWPSRPSRSNGTC